MKAVRRFTVHARVPDELSGLAELATNLRWTWHPPTRDLFASMDDALFQRIRDPLRMLAEVPASRLDELARDPEFLDRTRKASEDLQRYLTEPRWYQRRLQQAEDGERFPRAIAYVSMELGVHEAWPDYSRRRGVRRRDRRK